MKFPSVRCAAKPRMIVIIADDASRPPATALTCGITSRAERTPPVVTAATRPAAPATIPLCQSGIAALFDGAGPFPPTGARKRGRMIGGVVRERLHGTRVPVEVYLWSRIGIWLAALFSLAWFEPKPPPLR